MYYTNVKIIRDSNTIYQKLVPSHEVAVLKHVFDPESVIPQSGFVVTDRPYPSAEDEYQRLKWAYGMDPMTGKYHVELAYKNPAELWEAIPVLARAATAVVSAVRNFRIRPQERADLREQKTEQPERVYEVSTRATHEGMREAIEKSLLGIPDHDAERGRFQRD